MTKNKYDKKRKLDSKKSKSYAKKILRKQKRKNKLEQIAKNDKKFHRIFIRLLLFLSLIHI